MNKNELAHLLRTFNILSESLQDKGMTDDDRRNLLYLVNSERGRLAREYKDNGSTLYSPPPGPPRLPCVRFPPFI